jgi:organic radical activating enzyme
MNENFCQHPWIGLDISPQGNIRPCCKYNENIASSLIEYKDSEKLKKLRSEFKQGLKPIGCKRCWDDEAAGIPSKRQYDQKFNSTDLSHIRVLSLSLGNSCNLACRICDSYASSSWIKEQKKLKRHIPVQIYSHKRFYQDNKYMSLVKQLSENVVHVEFPGGEPFIAGIPEHLDFLDHLIAHKPENISLHYITNTSIFPKQEFWDKWKLFKNVDIQLSIDGTLMQFEYNRWPANWEHCYGNIKRYTDKKDQCSNLQLSVSHTVSIFTVFYLPEFIIWCLQNKLEKPSLGMIVDPSYYNIKTLPLAVKNKISKKLTRFSLQNVVKFMNSEDYSDNFPMTLKMIKLLDQQRQQDFKQVFPEFFKLIEE